MKSILAIAALSALVLPNAYGQDFKLEELKGPFTLEYAVHISQNKNPAVLDDQMIMLRKDLQKANTKEHPLTEAYINDSITRSRSHFENKSDEHFTLTISSNENNLLILKKQDGDIKSVVILSEGHQFTKSAKGSGALRSNVVSVGFSGLPFIGISYDRFPIQKGSTFFDPEGVDVTKLRYSTGRLVVRSDQGRRQISQLLLGPKNKETRDTRLSKYKHLNNVYVATHIETLKKYYGLKVGLNGIVVEQADYELTQMSSKALDSAEYTPEHYLEAGESAHIEDSTGPDKSVVFNASHGTLATQLSDQMLKARLIDSRNNRTKGPAYAGIALAVALAGGLGGYVFLKARRIR